MEKIAFISGGTFIYWSSIIMVLAVTTAIAVYIAMYLGKGGKVVPLAISIPVGIVVSAVLGRLIHWYCCTDQYSSFGAAMTDYSSGSYALMGAFIGCLLVACLLRLLGISKNLPQMLDCMVIGGGAGIAVGRLASMFNASARGIVLGDYVGMPYAFPVTNAVTGVSENRLASFMLQSVLAGAIVVMLLCYMLWCAIKKRKIKDGDICLLFLSAYGASQILMDSTRYDSLFLRANGFVSIVQILGAVALALAVIIFSVRLVKNRKMKFWYVPVWLVILALLGVAGYMEYYVQRHGDQAQFAYSLMSASLLVIVLMTQVIRGVGSRQGKGIAKQS